MPVGPVLFDSIMTLPFTANASQLSPTAIAAINRIVSFAISGGNYSKDAKDVFMPPDSYRPICAAAAGNAQAVDVANSGVLDIDDVAGIFIIQARERPLRKK